MYLVTTNFFASGNALFPRLHLFAKFSSGILVAVGCRSRLGRDGKGGGGRRSLAVRVAGVKLSERWNFKS